MAVVTKVPAFILEFNPNTLPFTWSNLPLGLAIWVASLHRFDRISQFFRNHSEKKYDSLFVDWLVPQTAKIDVIAVSRHALQLIVSMPGLWR